MALLTIWLNYYDEWENTFYAMEWHHENIPNRVIVEVADEVINTVRNWTQEEVNDILKFLYTRTWRTN